MPSVRHTTLCRAPAMAVCAGTLGATMGLGVSSTLATVAPAGATAEPGGSGAQIRQVDGGPDYYGRFSGGLPSDAAYFPLGVWLESVTTAADVAMDADAGLNTYVEVAGGSDMALLDGSGMHVMTSDSSRTGAATAAWILSDEVDMWGGPGDAGWSGDFPDEGGTCLPVHAGCGYTVQQTIGRGLPSDGRLRYSNYGKGVTFWETDSEASRFIGDFQDIVSADNYWFTDLNICDALEGGALFEDQDLSPEMCHRAANYGRTVDRLRQLVSPPGSKPVWALVELGHPFSEADWPTSTPAQAVAAVWSSIIHGARGIVYFNHSFSGSCVSYHVLRDRCYANVRAAIRQNNARITALAPVLNAPWADGVVTAGAGVDVATKWYEGHFYVLAGANRMGPQSAPFAAPCVGEATATVLNEDRSLPLSGGAFTDSFADGNAVHIYRIDGGSSCGAA